MITASGVRRFSMRCATFLLSHQTTEVKGKGSFGTARTWALVFLTLNS